MDQGAMFHEMESQNVGPNVKIAISKGPGPVNSDVYFNNWYKLCYGIGPEDNGLVAKIVIPDEYLKPDVYLPSGKSSKGKSKDVWKWSVIYILAILDTAAIILHYILPLFGTQYVDPEVPVGSIMAWVPTPNQTWIPDEDLPIGWQICNGSVILDESSPWVGQLTPNLTGRFLRGGDLINFLDFQEDQIQDHYHFDPGHTHTDQGHTHTDGGHTHTDTGHTHQDTGHSHTDQGHTHTDSGHGHSDAGHNHGYEDRSIGGSGGDIHDNYIAGGLIDPSDTGRSTDQGKAQIETGFANINAGQAVLSTDSANIAESFAKLNVSFASLSTNQAIISSSSSNIGGVTEAVLDARAGAETRPKATFVIWIMKITDIVV